MGYSNQHLGIDLILDNDGELVISPSGDLAITENGRQSLLQDIKYLLETMPGDLFSNKEYGTGLGRLLGNENEKNQKKLIKRAISDALIYNQSIASRIEPEEIKFAVSSYSDEAVTIELEIESFKETVNIKIY